MMLVVYYIITMILTKELVMATDQCSKYRFKSPFYPGDSCEMIYSSNPESRDRSGYYWITVGPTRVYCGMAYTGSSCVDIYNNNPETGDKSGYYRINDTQWTYCNMTEIASAIAVGDIIFTCAGMGGQWKRIVNIDISAGNDCPSGWRQETYSDVSFCRVVSDDWRTCSSANFSTNGTSYQRVCGRARGYQKGETDSFNAYHNQGQTIDGYYADGLLITYGNPRQHIWTYVSGVFDDNGARCCNCPCSVGGGLAPPSFVGTNYYCESGAITTYNISTYYFNDPLWDRSDCYSSTNCCTNPTQPWFYRQLSESTTSDIEARICRQSAFANGSPLIDQLELYIQ
ncbi:uncharacterized protein [Dysidea avara]|uniref:uncharacterized protein n=1 Tax=Dysidea avara TaxID=196820 RepID=UPI00332F4A8D